MRPMNEPTKDRGNGDGSRAKGPGLGAMLLAALVGGAIGATVDRVFFHEEPVAAAQAALPAQAAPLEDELKALSAAIADLQKSVDKLAQPAPPAPLGATPDVEAMLAELVAAVSESTQRLRDANTAPLVIPPLDAEMQHRLEALPLQSDTLDDQHLFWPAQALLDAYGRPGVVFVNDRGEQWQYDLAKPHSITFTLHDGRVIEVYAE